MNAVRGIVVLGLVLALIFPLSAEAQTSTPRQAPSAEKPGDIERAALAKVDFVVGDWVGSQTRDIGRQVRTIVDPLSGS